MTTEARPRTRALAAFVLCTIALVIITAIFASAVSSSRTATKLEKVTNDLTALRDSDKKQQTGTLKARATLMHQNAVTAYQLRVTQEQNRVLIRLLRAQGIQPPSSTLPPRSTASSSADPKAPRRHPHPSPGSPAPTAPNPSAPSSPSCVLLPVACPFLPLPTVFP